MPQVSERELAAIKVVVFDELCSLSKKFDKQVGDFVVFVKADDSSDVFGVLVGFVNSAKLTPKDVKTIKKSVSATILKKLQKKVDVHLASEVNNNIEHEILNYDSRLNVSTVIPRHHFAQALRELLQGEKEFFAEALSRKIDQTIESLYREDSPKTFGDLQLDFIHLLWPTVDRVCARYPGVIRKNALSIMSVREYAAITLEEAADVLIKSMRHLDEIIQDYPVITAICYELRHDSSQSVALDEFNELLATSENPGSLQALFKLRSQYEKLLEKNQRITTDVSVASGHLRVALSLFKKLYGFHRYLVTHRISSDFRKLIGIEWCPDSEDLEDCFSVNAWPKHQKILGELAQREIWHLEITDLLPVMIKSVEECIAVIEMALAEEAAEKKIEKLRLSKQSKQTKQTDSQTKDLTVNSSPLLELKATPQSTESFTKSSKESAKEVEARLQAKQAARQQKRYAKGLGLFEAQDAKETEKATLYSLRLTHLATGVESELDLCLTAKRSPDSPYFVLLPNAFVLAEANPMVMLTEQQRRLLYANEGRGFIGSVCHGKTGVKYVRDGKDAYAILKAATEERVFCAIKTCISAAFGGSVDLLIPMLSVKNHEDYERLLQRANIAAWLRGQCDDQLLIEESSLEDSASLRN